MNNNNKCDVVLYKPSYSRVYTNFGVITGKMVPFIENKLFRMNSI